MYIYTCLSRSLSLSLSVCLSLSLCDCLSLCVCLRTASDSPPPTRPVIATVYGDKGDTGAQSLDSAEGARAFELGGCAAFTFDAGGWVDAWMDGWVGGCMNGWVGGCMDGWMGGWVMDGCMDACMDGWVSGWMHG